MVTEACTVCGVTPHQAELGRRTEQLLAGAAERKLQPAKPDDVIDLMRRIAAEHGYVVARRADLGPGWTCAEGGCDQPLVDNDWFCVKHMGYPKTDSCVLCGGVIGWIDCPTGGWWSHEKHPADEHDAEPRSDRP